MVGRQVSLRPLWRSPLLQWPREAFDGQPPHVAERFDAYDRWLADTPDVPKLLLTVEPQVGIAFPRTRRRYLLTLA